MELLWLAGLLRELFDIEIVPVAFGDSSSALTLVSRAGMGRSKHVELRMLAIQEWVQAKRLLLRKIQTEDNLADIGTKFLAPRRVAKLAEALGVRYSRGKRP